MAGPHGGYPIPPDVVHHSHMSYRMLQPSFQMPHALNLSAPMSGPNARTGQISNDLGPPIFMPRKLTQLFFLCFHTTITTYAVIHVNTCEFIGNNVD